jgi:hypothetical protein
LKRSDITEAFKEASKSVCTSTVVVSPDSLSHTQTASVMKTPENTEEDPDDPEPADEDTQMEYSSN